MDKLEMYQPIIEATIAFGQYHNIARMKVETLDFDFDFRLDADNSFQLVSTKAVIRVLGKLTKVPLGEGDTYESAYEATKKHWQQYFKDYRDTYAKTPATKRGERRRAKAYQQRRRDHKTTILERD